MRLIEGFGKRLRIAGRLNFIQPVNQPLDCHCPACTLYENKANTWCIKTGQFYHCIACILN